MVIQTTPSPHLLSRNNPFQRIWPWRLEVFCKPFTLWQLLKGPRFLPTAKRRHEQHSFSSSSSTCPPAVLRCGRLQSVESRGGLPSYRLIIDETEETFAAKTLRIDGGLEEGVSHVYAFYSCNGKGKGKSGWRQRTKQEKPGSDFVGTMTCTVTSRISPLLSSNDVGNFVECEFVLFDATVKEILISGSTPTSPYPRSSLSSGDTAAPQSSPNGPAQTRQNLVEARLPKMSNLGSPEIMSDSGTANECESQASASGRPQSQAEVAAVVVRIPLEKTLGKVARAREKWGWGANFLRSVDSTRSRSSPNQTVATGDSSGSKDGARENAFTRTTDHLSGRSSTNSCTNFRGGSLPDKRVAREDSPGSKYWARENAFTTDDHVSGSSSTDSCTDFTEQLCGACGSTSGDEQSQEGTNITLILPSGEHGCSANGIDGPQPLIERWRSGGTCDCGSWDLGCGLTIAGNHRVDTVDPKEQRDSTLRLYVEGKKQATVGLALTPRKKGCYTLGFHDQGPISALHAFATTVAVLHSSHLIIAARKKEGKTKRGLQDVLQHSCGSCTAYIPVIGDH